MAHLAHRRATDKIVQEPVSVSGHRNEVGVPLLGRVRKARRGTMAARPQGPPRLLPVSFDKSGLST